MYVRFAQSDPAGVHTFYVSSFTAKDHGVTLVSPVEWVVKHLRRGSKRRWSCSCPDFFHVAQVKGRHCKHIKLVKRIIELLGGMQQIPRGATINEQGLQTHTSTIDSRVITSGAGNRRSRAGGNGPV